MTMSFCTKMIGLLGLGLASGCVHTQEVPAQNMSAQEHEQVATVEQTEAKQDEERAWEDSASKPDCPGGNREGCGALSTEYQRLAARHRELAAQHRAASQALRDAEARDCVGVTGDSLDMSPFAFPHSVRAVEKLREPMPVPNYGASRSEMATGASVVLNAAPGLNLEWLQTLVNCHIARNAALGFAVGPLENGPLNIANITARVRSVGNGFAVDIESEDKNTVREIIHRAQALTAPPSEPSNPAGVATSSPPASPAQ